MENDRNASYDMRTYIGTKTVQAMRMNAADAKRAGANVPDKYFTIGKASFNPGADGYLVIYDGGYRSWSPMRVFEQAYKIAESEEDLVRIEIMNLGRRIQKVCEQIFTPYTPITEHQRELLLMQDVAMRRYYRILRIRLAEMDKYHNEIERQRIQSEEAMTNPKNE